MSDLKEDDEENTLFGKLCLAYLGFTTEVQNICKSFSDDELREIIPTLRKQALPGPTEYGSKNFAVPAFDLLADKVESELGFRSMWRRYDEFEKKNPDKQYCLHCDGECRPEHYDTF